jgi:hypothetical protein
VALRVASDAQASVGKKSAEVPPKASPKTYTDADMSQVIERLAQALMSPDCCFDSTGLRRTALQDFIDRVQGETFSAQVPLISQLRKRLKQLPGPTVRTLVRKMAKGRPIYGFQRYYSSNQMDIIVFTGDPDNLLVIEDSVVTVKDPRA